MSKSVSDDPLLLSVHFDFEYQKTKESGFVFYTYAFETGSITARWP